MEEDGIKDYGIGDIGAFDVPEIDLSLIDFIAADGVEETRFTRPRLIEGGSRQVMYDNAAALAREIDIQSGMRVDAFVSGNFIFGDFIEAFLTEKDARAERMTISTLSLSQNNVDSLAELLRNDYIGQLDMIVSVYFWGNERGELIPYMYRELDMDNRFQLAVADVHTKTVHFETAGGKKIVIHGSANLRSSGNVEQFTIEENPALYDFYEEKLGALVAKYATIRKNIRSQQVWETMDRKRL